MTLAVVVGLTLYLALHSRRHRREARLQRRFAQIYDLGVQHGVQIEAGRRAREVHQLERML
jgi:hypothetical protein